MLIQERLKIIRNLYFEVLPNSKERIRYKIPAFKVGQNHLYFAAYKKHIGFYHVYGLTDIEDEILKYRAKNTKDSLHFMHKDPIPIDLIKKIIKMKSTR